jgi:hypothetical protein
MIAVQHPVQPVVRPEDPAPGVHEDAERGSIAEDPGSRLRFGERSAGRGDLVAQDRVGPSEQADDEPGDDACCEEEDCDEDDERGADAAIIVLRGGRSSQHRRIEGATMRRPTAARSAAGGPAPKVR